MLLHSSIFVNLFMFSLCFGLVVQEKGKGGFKDYEENAKKGLWHFIWGPYIIYFSRFCLFKRREMVIQTLVGKELKATGFYFGFY